VRQRGQGTRIEYIAHEATVAMKRDIQHAAMDGGGVTIADI